MIGQYPADRTQFGTDYAAALTYWPSVIDLHDARLLTSGGLRSANLIGAYALAERRAITKAETVITWIILQQLHHAAKQVVRQGGQMLLLADAVRQSAVLARYSSTLQDEEYSDVLGNLLESYQVHPVWS